MLWELQLILFVLLVIAAIIALEVRDLLASVVALGFYSFFSTILLVVMGAIDVAFTEAVLGAGVTGVLLVAGIFAMRRRSVD
jgi:multicomponent Na+:H+ antiporter subunit B